MPFANNREIIFGYDSLMPSQVLSRGGLGIELAVAPVAAHLAQEADAGDDAAQEEHNDAALYVRCV